MIGVMYCLATCVHDHMLGYIREAKTLKEALGNLRKIFTTNITARKIQENNRHSKGQSSHFLRSSIDLVG